MDSIIKSTYNDQKDIINNSCNHEDIIIETNEDDNKELLNSANLINIHEDKIITLHRLLEKEKEICKKKFKNLTNGEKLIFTDPKKSCLQICNNIDDAYTKEINVQQTIIDKYKATAQKAQEVLSSFN